MSLCAGETEPMPPQNGNRIRSRSSQFFSFEWSLHGTATGVKNVDRFDDRHRVDFSGFSSNLRYALINRGPGDPIGLTVTAEPEWARVDGDSRFRPQLRFDFQRLSPTRH